MYTITERQAETLRRVHSHVRKIHDEVRALRRIVGEPVDLVLALDFGPTASGLAVSGTISAIDTLCLALDHQIVSLGEVTGRHLPLYPEIDDREAMAPGDIEFLARGEHLTLVHPRRTLPPDDYEAEVFPRLRQPVEVSARTIAMQEAATHFIHHVAREGSPDDDALRADAAVRV